jgi:hypothetical protein
MTDEQHYETFGRQEMKMDPSLGRNKSNRPWKLGVNTKYNIITIQTAEDNIIQ